MEKQVRSVNYAFKIVGNLGHDNKLFDRTCPVCRKGMYSSRKYSRCPKCGGALGYITNAEGKAIAISEGTVYPAFGPGQEKSDAMAIAKRKNGMPIKYRFKMFSFIDEHGVLIPPANHDRCRSGARVEIMIMKHQPVPSWFMGKDDNNPNSKTKVPWVEWMLPIYTNAPYNDYVKVLTAQEYASATISHGVQANGVPTPIVTQPTDPNTMQQLDGEIAAMEQRIAAIKAVRVNMATPTPQPSSPPWEGQNQLVSNTNNSVDPFAHA